jgi:putative DNA primase/helicase
MKFKDMALEAVGRGLAVCRLKPGDKRPLSSGWLTEATTSKMVIESWHSENPDYNCGAVVTEGCGYWVVDVDCLDFFMEECPYECLPSNSLVVETGGGGRHFYFSGVAPWPSVKHVPNPNKERWKKPDGSECTSVIDIICPGGQVLVAGNIHPKTGRPYTVKADMPLAPCPAEFIGWLRQLLEAKPKAKPAAVSAKATSSQSRTHDNAWELDKSWDPEVELAKAGLKYERKEREGKVFFNYHVLMGKCLTKGALHLGDAGGNENNNECSAFVFDPKTRQLWHKCHAGSCSFQGREGEEVALAALDIDPKRAFYLEGRVTARVRWSDMAEAEHIEWLWPGYLVSNRLTMFTGESTQGKSPVTLALIAAVTRGADWPDGSKNELGPRSVLLLAAEDNWADTILPRLFLSGADVPKVGQVEVQKNIKMDQVTLTPTLDEHIPIIRDAVRQIPDLSLIVIDPIQNYLGRLQMNDEGEMRRILQPLADMCHELNVCTVLTGHLNKKTDAKSIQDRIMGARAFQGVARQIFFFDNDPDSTDRFAHVMVPFRFAPYKEPPRSIKYHTEAVMFTKDGLSSEQVVAKFDGFSEATVDDVGKGGSTKDKQALDEAVLALREFLKDGQRPASECYELLAANGVQCQSQGGSVNEKRLRDRASVESIMVSKVRCWRIKATAEAGDDFVGQKPAKQADISFDVEDM